MENIVHLYLRLVPPPHDPAVPFMTEKIQTEKVTTNPAEEKFELWKKNTPVLYDFFLYHSLDWISLTVEWLPTPTRVDPDTSLSVHSIIFGTHTSNRDPNFLFLADVYMPRAAQSSSSIPRVDVVKQFRTDGEVNRARCMPQKPNLVAVKSSRVEVYVFDTDKDGSGSFNPDLRLRGHEKQGYRLSWNPFKEGYLLSGSNDHNICLWDVSSMPENKVVDAMNVYKAHEDNVKHVAWHTKNQNLFGSVGDDRQLMIWDLRTDHKPQHSVLAHKKKVNYLSFNPFNEWLVATASSDTTIGLFDLRKLDSPLHFLSNRMEEVFQVEWDPHHETVLASSDDDKRVMVRDITRIGDEHLIGEDPPELLFSHVGHTCELLDFSWNQSEAGTISSVGYDNTVQVWRMPDSIYRDQDELPTV